MTGVVERVVDPRQRARSGVLVDRRQLPVCVARSGPAHPALEVQERQARGQAEQARQVFLGLLLPAAGPHQVEVGG